MARRRHEATAENGAGDDLPITVAPHDVRLPRRVDHVQHHEAAGEHALRFAKLGNGMLEPMLPEDAPPDDQGDEDAPANRRCRQDDQRADVRADRPQRQCADRADDDTVDRDSAETFDRATIDGPLEIVPLCAELNEHCGRECKGKEWKPVEEAGPDQVKYRAKQGEQRDGAAMVTPRKTTAAVT